MSNLILIFIYKNKMSEIYIFILDNSNNTKEEINIIKPNTFRELVDEIRKLSKYIPEYYEIFILDKINNKIKINN